MKGRGPRNKLHREGMTFRELSSLEGFGFVARILRDEIEPPLITTVVKQPGHDRVIVETVETSASPYWPHRLHGSRPVEPEGFDTIVDTLESRLGPDQSSHAIFVLDLIKSAASDRLI